MEVKKTVEELIDERLEDYMSDWCTYSLRMMMNNLLINCQKM